MKNKYRFSLILIFLAACLFFSGTFFGLASGEEKFTPVRGKDLFVPGEYIVSYKIMPFESGSLSQAKAAEACQNAKMSVIKIAQFAPILSCRLQPGENFEQVKAALLKDKRIRSVSPNYIAWVPEPKLKSQTTGQRVSSNRANILTQTGDPLLIDQWGYFQIQANYTSDLPSSAPMIAVIDTGVDYNHPDLKGKVQKGPDLVNNDNDPMDDYGHGTHVAGIAAAISNNEIGIAGISGKSKIYAVKVLNSQGWGTYTDVIDGIYAAANKSDVKVINMSLGGPDDETLQEAVQYAVTTKGKVLVAAAGNDGISDPEDPLFGGYPAFYPEAIAVAASDDTDAKATFSNYGNAWVDIAAPGVSIISTLPYAIAPLGYDWWDGTSMATPFVAGAAARVWAAFPALTNAEVRNAVQATGDTLPPGGWPEVPTFTRLNLYNALGLTSIPFRAMISGEYYDGITGLPLLGAKIEAVQGSTVKGVDYVPVDGLSQMIINPGTNYRFRIRKSKYPTITIPLSDEPAMSFAAGDDEYLGVIAIAPGQGTWQLAMTWEDGFYDFDTYLWVPYDSDYVLIGFSGDSWGNMRDFPWARWNRDAYVDSIPVESFSMKKTLKGTYYLAVYNYEGDDFQDLNAKFFIYRGSTLVDIVKAQEASGSGTAEWWYVGKISGSTFTPFNRMQTEPPVIISGGSDSFPTHKNKSGLKISGWNGLFGEEEASFQNWGELKQPASHK